MLHVAHTSCGAQATAMSMEYEVLVPPASMRMLLCGQGSREENRGTRSGDDSFGCDRHLVPGFGFPGTWVGRSVVQRPATAQHTTKICYT